MAYPGQQYGGQPAFDPNNPQFYSANAQPQFNGYNQPPQQYGQPMQPMQGYQQPVGGQYVQQQPMTQPQQGQYYYNEQQAKGGVPMGQPMMGGQQMMQPGTMPCPDCNGTGEIDCCSCQRCTRCCTGCCEICAGCLCACCLESVLPDDSLGDEMIEDAGILYGCYKGCSTCFGSRCRNCKGRGFVVAGPPGRQGMF